MSTWYEVKNKNNVTISECGKEVHVLYRTDNWGNRYLAIPIEFIKELLTKEKEYEKN